VLSVDTSENVSDNVPSVEPTPRQGVDALLAMLKNAQEMVNKQHADVEASIATVREEGADMEKQWKVVATDRESLKDEMESSKQRRTAQPRWLEQAGARLNGMSRDQHGQLLPIFSTVDEMLAEVQASTMSTAYDGSTLTELDGGFSIDAGSSALGTFDAGPSFLEGSAFQSELEVGTSLNEADSGSEPEPEAEAENVCAECSAEPDSYCPECEDLFCTSCFDRLHAKGNRALHPRLDKGMAGFRSNQQLALPAEDEDEDDARNDSQFQLAVRQDQPPGRIWMQ